MGSKGERRKGRPTAERNTATASDWREHGVRLICSVVLLGIGALSLTGVRYGANQARYGAGWSGTSGVVQDVNRVTTGEGRGASQAWWGTFIPADGKNPADVGVDVGLGFSAGVGVGLRSEVSVSSEFDAPRPAQLDNGSSTNHTVYLRGSVQVIFGIALAVFASGFTVLTLGLAAIVLCPPLKPRLTRYRKPLVVRAWWTWTGGSFVVMLATGFFRP